ncbi:MAG: hypothetical protein JWP03_626 [Phycisphaerales bacterium]|nr:hypothetical protein [Phycisphaerales bacterium]
MWDDPTASVEPDPQPFEQSDPAANVAWTDGQLIRLENEWRRAQRSFAYHPYIGITPLRGDPPYEYQVDFRVRSLVLNEAGELQSVDTVAMHVWLPPGFPNQPPVARPMAGVFHPNVAWEGVYLTNPWQPTWTLPDFLARIGELLAFRTYDPDSVVNATAMDWVVENSGALPLDAQADFSPAAGGEPLGRIMRFGPATVDQIRRALDDMRFALVAENDDAPTGAEVEDFSRKTRAALSLFLDGDVPESLREQASEFDDWCQELPDSVPAWEYLRQQRAAARSAEETVAGLRDAAKPLLAQLAKLDALVTLPPDVTASAAVRAIPAMPALEPLQLALPNLARDYEDRVNALRGYLEAMRAQMPQVNVAPDRSLGRRIAAQTESVAQTVASARSSGEAALAGFEPLLRRAKAEAGALEQIVGWREYTDMFIKARALERQAAELGSAGVHAYFIENDSGKFGPFQFEEPLDLGGTRVAVRNNQRGAIDVIDAVGNDLLGRSTDGAVTITFGQAEGIEGYPTAFRLTERCDDLAIHISFIQRQTAEGLAGLQHAVPAAKSWCGVVCGLLADPRSQAGLREEHRKSGHRWKSLITDLGQLGRFKERLATYHLVERMTQEVPRIKDLINQAKGRLKDATQKITAIMQKCSRDLETDRLIVPPKYAQSYTEQLRVRDQAKHEIVRLDALCKKIARELAERLGSPRACGRPEVPQFRSQAPLPDAIVDLEPTLADENLAAMVESLGALLNVTLPFKPPPAPEITAAPIRPATPTSAGVAAEPEQLPEAIAEPDPAGEPLTEFVGPALESPEQLAAVGGEEIIAAEPEHPAHEGEEGYKQPEEEMIEGFFTEDPAHQEAHPDAGQKR